MRNKTKKSKIRLLTFAIYLLMIAGFTSCSSTSSGTGEGDGSAITDEDLSLGSNNLGGARFGSGNIPDAASRDGGGPFSDIHFGYDAAGVDSEYQSMIKASAQELIKDPMLKTEVEGHCDKRGTPEYNLALGESRAKSVSKLLIQYGANPKQITTISYGEEIPLDPSENDSAYAKNRRVHFALFKEGQKANR